MCVLVAGEGTLHLLKAKVPSYIYTVQKQVCKVQRTQSRAAAATPEAGKLPTSLATGRGQKSLCELYRLCIL